MTKVKCIEIGLYEGDVTDITVEPDILHMFIALTPSVPPTPCFFFQSYEVFENTSESTLKTEDIEIIFNISKTITDDVFLEKPNLTNSKRV